MQSGEKRKKRASCQTLSEVGGSTPWMPAGCSRSAYLAAWRQWKRCLKAGDGAGMRKAFGCMALMTAEQDMQHAASLAGGKLPHGAALRGGTGYWHGLLKKAIDRHCRMADDAS